MRYLKMKRVIVLVLLLTLVGVAGFGSVANSPPNDNVASAKKTSELLHNEIFAALIQEFNETTPENVEEGKEAISLIFNNANKEIRLVGIFPPLLGGINNLPSDSFEGRSLTLALQGQPNTSIERIGNRWYYRRSDPLSNTFHQNCVLCHKNFNNVPTSGQWVGTLLTRVPIKTD
jgi:hypothetical protein